MRQQIYKPRLEEENFLLKQCLIVCVCTTFLFLSACNMKASIPDESFSASTSISDETSLEVDLGLVAAETRFIIPGSSWVKKYVGIGVYYVTDLLNAVIKRP